MSTEMKVEDIASYDLSSLDRDKLLETLSSLQTLVVRQDEQALEVARKFQDDDGGLVVVVDRTGQPRAIIDPSEIRARLETEKGIRSRSLHDALEQFAADPEEAGRSFRHEWLGASYAPYWCEAGQHYTTPAPCRIHER